MARKGIFSDNILPAGKAEADRPAPRKPDLMPRGAVGALQSSLARMQESAVQDVDPGLIDDAGLEDRLGLDSTAQKQLVESLRTYGQQVPVLLRPHPEKRGRYEIVYGRRRLRALRELGLPVKAMVRQLDDHALVMAQGQENTARQDLSFIEKASFAAQLQDAGYDRPTIAAALSIDLPMVSRMLKVGTAFPLPFLRQIGSAPAIGRDRWMLLVDALKAEGAHNRVHAFLNRPEFTMLDTNARFEAVLERALARPEAPKPAPKAPPRMLSAGDGTEIGQVKQTPRGVTLTVHARDADGFDQWLGDNAEALVRELHDRWANHRSEGKE